MSRGEVKNYTALPKTPNKTVQFQMPSGASINYTIFQEIGTSTLLTMQSLHQGVICKDIQDQDNAACLDITAPIQSQPKMTLWATTYNSRWEELKMGIPVDKMDEWRDLNQVLDSNDMNIILYYFYRIAHSVIFTLIWSHLSDPGFNSFGTLMGQDEGSRFLGIRSQPLGPVESSGVHVDYVGDGKVLGQGGGQGFTPPSGACYHLWWDPLSDVALCALTSLKANAYLLLRDGHDSTSSWII
ncbi:uncharacterized protein LACBIDRAFT_333322 [Laccaria bicolor S238N-H82]|uniref:Predicted protein n=1 Tax=Laccaria bicolor (strain S238N-H82 / ATCC MYA-4686) TaxID=486041 RepID=B0DVK2_LACBS|nr:uncharacterized protein LACBIDRAFT_333322 [Laccaria bicolor S238N-H82]EDR01401.1 predicted protein [Laccaria bicolor S238N-H82]|eukprot:XP_001887946.1 predicted protein [Laccaria bicolor S238N-H82]